jgi:hypothetical protein
LLAFTVLVFSVAFVVAQPGGGGPPGGGGGGGKGPPCGTPPCNPVPITGIEYLLGAGALIGVRYLRKRRR